MTNDMTTDFSIFSLKNQQLIRRGQIVIYNIFESIIMW